MAAMKSVTAAKNKIKTSRVDKIYYVLTNTFLFCFFMIILLPLLNVVASSFSNSVAVNQGKVLFWPVDPTLEGYKAVFEYPGIWRSYANTFLYTITGTIVNLVMTMIAAYPLARKGLPFKGVVVALFMFTMLFSGGTIPNYLLIKQLGMIDTIWAMIVPGAISVYNMIIARTFIQNSIPNDLLEASQIDGCSDARYFFQIVLPLSKAIMAVLTLYYAVGHWNSYFNAFIYLSKRELYPLQIILREILIENSIDAEALMDEQMAAQKAGLADLLQYALIVVSTAPILCIYPFVQKYFIKGVMIGSVKG